MIRTTEVGFDADEIRTDEPTRSARLKWVVVVDSSLPPGRAANAAICVASATTAAVTGLTGPDATDPSGAVHPGLPWAGCTVLGAPGADLAPLRARAAESPGVFVADMPTSAQSTRVYDEYLTQVSGADTLEYHAISIVGPRNRVDKLVRKLALP